MFRDAMLSYPAISVLYTFHPIQIMSHSQFLPSEESESLYNHNPVQPHLIDRLRSTSHQDSHPDMLAWIRLGKAQQYHRHVLPDLTKSLNVQHTLAISSYEANKASENENKEEPIPTIHHELNNTAHVNIVNYHRLSCDVLIARSTIHHYYPTPYYEKPPTKCGDADINE